MTLFIIVREWLPHTSYAKTIHILRHACGTNTVDTYQLAYKMMCHYVWQNIQLLIWCTRFWRNEKRYGEGTYKSMQSQNGECNVRNLKFLFDMSPGILAFRVGLLKWLHIWISWNWSWWTLVVDTCIRIQILLLTFKFVCLTNCARIINLL